jgi:hypothetical protein
MIFDWLGIDVKVPSFDSIRVWACRVGIAPLKRPVRDGEAWILGFINRHGVYHGAAAKLKIELDEVRTTHPPRCELSATMAERLIAFVEASESKLPAGERAWLSTENLESLFGQYKRLEGQHSKGGFTSLIAALPMLLTHWTPDNVRESLTAVPVQGMKQWLRENLATTLTSKRATAYREVAKSSG